MEKYYELFCPHCGKTKMLVRTICGFVISWSELACCAFDPHIPLLFQHVQMAFERQKYSRVQITRAEWEYALSHLRG